MKQIVINEIKNPDPSSSRKLRHFYQVSMPYQPYDFYFKNKKDARAFVAGLSRHLNIMMSEFNLFVSDVYRIYRQLWAYCPDDQMGGYFAAIDQRFDYLVKGLGLYSTMADFNTILNILGAILDYLLKVSSQNKQFSMKHHIKVMIKNLERLTDQLFGYGEKSRFRVDHDYKKLS